MNNYKTDLDATLVRKHVLQMEIAAKEKELKDLSERADALNVLSGSPYSHKTLAEQEHQIVLDLSRAMFGNWQLDGTTMRRMVNHTEHIDEYLEREHPVTDANLLTYAGILIDLKEYHGFVDKPISAGRYYLRVYFNDDVEAFVAEMAPKVGLVKVS